jgi:hypothetical protein
MKSRGFVAKAWPVQPLHIIPKNVLCVSQSEGEAANTMVDVTIPVDAEAARALETSRRFAANRWRKSKKGLLF